MAPAIGDLIPFDDPKLPILHHVAKHAPQYMKEFACRYLHVRVGIHLQHISGIAREEHCTKCTCKWKQDFIDDPMFFLGMSDEQVREIDLSFHGCGFGRDV